MCDVAGGKTEKKRRGVRSNNGRAVIDGSRGEVGNSMVKERNGVGEARVV